MRYYRFRLPSSFIIPGILGILILAILVPVGIILVGIILTVMIVLALGSALYRTFFPNNESKMPDFHREIKISSQKKRSLDDIPYSEYTEIDTSTDNEDRKD